MRPVIVFALWLGLAGGLLGAFAFSQLFSGAGAAPGQGAPVMVISPLDEGGNVKVHEQGTATVNVANSTLPVHEQGTANVNLTNSVVPVHEQGTASVRVDNASPIAVSVQGATPMQPATRSLYVDGEQQPLGSYEDRTWYADPPINASLIYADVRAYPGRMVVWVTLGAANAPLGEMDLGYLGAPDPQAKVIQFTQLIPVSAVTVRCLDKDGCGWYRVLAAGN